MDMPITNTMKLPAQINPTGTIIGLSELLLSLSANSHSNGAEIANITKAIAVIFVILLSKPSLERSYAYTATLSIINAGRVSLPAGTRSDPV